MKSTGNYNMLAIIIVVSMIITSIGGTAPGPTYNIKGGPAEVMDKYKGYASGTDGTAGALPITYRLGAPVLTGLTRVHLVYYGSWTSIQIDLVNTFISLLESTNWFRVEKTYYYQAAGSNARSYISGPLNLGSIAIDCYSRGNKITSADITQIIYDQIYNAHLPNEPYSVYLLLSSPDVSESFSATASFCTAYCGYHSYFTVGTSTYRYGFIGNPKNCISSCSSTNYYISPNGDPGVDAMFSVIAHEIAETMSDPELNAWADASGYENADKCAWNFGAVSSCGTGCSYNVVVQGRKYLLQQNWNANTQQCAMST